MNTGFEPAKVTLMEVLIAVLRDAPKITYLKLFILAALSSCSNTAILALINHAIVNQTDVELRIITFLGFAASILCFRAAHKSLIIGTSTLAESTIHSMRVRFLDRIQAVNLRDVERLNREDIYVCVNSEMEIIADAAFTFTTIIETTLILAVTMAYLALLSIIGFMCVLGFVLVATMIHLRHSKLINSEHQVIFGLESMLLGGFTDLIDGFKEVKMNTMRSSELVDKAKNASRLVFERKMVLNNVLASNHINSQIAYFGFMTAIVFLTPIIWSESGKNVVTTAVSALFLIGPTFALINSIPSLQKINAAATAILALETRIGKIDPRIGEETSMRAISAKFDTISMNQVTFQYDNGKGGFKFGPINLKINCGQIVFITGGNGSGKSTLLKLLTGLYTPNEGVLMIDGQQITTENVVSYRNLFSAIFSDYHLFKTLYGIPESDPHEVDSLFRLVELEKKTHLAGRSFESIDLSSGQKKRLALIAVLLEHRPICVFDEWAADQDVHFRKKFYNIILPWLKKMGKTVIAVTHDEKYFDIADFRLNLDSVTV
jgi:putative ATP-binding cassette transporter